MSRWSIVAAVLAAGCASSQASFAPEGPGEPVQPEIAMERVLDATGLERAREAFEQGERGTAYVLADSLWTDWVGRRDLDRESAEDLSDLLESVGAEDRAADLWVQAPFPLNGGDRKRLRALVARLSIREMELLQADSAGNASGRSVVQAELAHALAVAGHPDRAQLMAAAVLDADPDGTERRRAEEVAEGSVTPARAPVRVGVVLPASGRFSGVGEQILEGALLAVERYKSDPTRSPVELVVMDDSSQVQLGIDLVEQLEEQDVVAVVGPVRTEALVSAAIRRDSDDMFLISPTAASGQGIEPDAYSLWDRDRRETDVAVALVSWMADVMGMGTFGVLYPGGWSSAALAALESKVEEGGGRVLAAESYVTDSTTFGAPITALAEAEPDAVVVFADGPRTVLQLAPQLVYYGLRRWLTGGDVNWSDPSVVRQLDPSYADHRVVATYLDRASAGTPWQAFKAEYEAKYRKGLPDNMFTALGFDAMNLVLLGIPEAEPTRRSSIGRAVRRGVHPGATGDLVVDPSTDELHREVFVRVIQDGTLEAPDPMEMGEWVEQQRQLEEFLRALEEEKEQQEDGR